MKNFLDRNIGEIFGLIIIFGLLIPIHVSADTTADIFAVPSMAPADATFYIISGKSSGTPSATTGCSVGSGNSAGVVVKTGTLTDIAFTVSVAGTLPTNEAMSIWLQINGTDYLLSASSSAITNRSNTFAFSNLIYPVTTGDYMCIKILTPVWVTNPTSVNFFGAFKINDSPGGVGSDTASTDQTHDDVIAIVFAFFAAFMGIIWLLRSRK